MRHDIVELSAAIQLELCILLSGRLSGTHVTPDLSVQAVKLIILRFDDLIPEESDVVLTAIKRLPSKEAYDRTFRIRRAFQVRLRPAPSKLSTLICLVNTVLRFPHHPSRS
jgi:hypothetical protein